MRWNKAKIDEWMTNLRHQYRLVIMNDETFEEVGSYRLTMLNVYVLFSTVLVVVAIIIFALMAYTPLKRYIPGFDSHVNQQELIALNRQLDSLENLLVANEQYAANLRMILVGDIEETQPEVLEPEVVQDSLPPVQPSEVDEQLRKEVELEMIGSLAQQTNDRSFSGNQTRLEQLYFATPVSGEISAGFAPDQQHFGVDILAPKNTAVKAVLDGYILFSDWTLETGNTIAIQHANNIVTIYKHNSSLLKKAGSYVQSGEAIAIIGNTGTLSDGPHLHFELWSNGKPLDPTLFVSF